MKRLMLLALPLALLACAGGCDEVTLSGGFKSLAPALALNGDLTQLQTHTQNQLQLQLHDGTCTSAGNQYGPSDSEYGGSGPGGESGGDRDRLRDGSCGD